MLICVEIVLETHVILLILREEAGYTSDGCTASSLGVETRVSLQRGHCTPLGACAEEERRPQLWKDEPVLSFVES